MKTEIPLVLYSSPRPGYDFGRNAKVPRKTVDEWLKGVQAKGIASVLCLLSDDRCFFDAERRNTAGKQIAASDTR